MNIWPMVLIAGITVFCILFPFIVGKGGSLQATASVNNIDQLEKMREAILQRFVKDENLFQSKELNAMAWEQRRNFLVNRYIDATHRLDYLKAADRKS